LTVDLRGLTSLTSFHWAGPRTRDACDEKRKGSIAFMPSRA
jgi:hypothetical protein